MKILPKVENVFAIESRNQKKGRNKPAWLSQNLLTNNRPLAVE
jgi:hypothetical protein